MNGVELQRDKTFTENKIKNGVVLELKVTKTFEYAFLKIVKQGKSYWPHIFTMNAQKNLISKKTLLQSQIQFDLCTLLPRLDRQIQLAQYNIISNSIINCENTDAIKPENQTITAKILYNNQEYQIPINQESLVSDLEQKINEKFSQIQNFQLFKDGVQQLQSKQKINTLNAKYFQVSLQQQQILQPQNMVIFINYLIQTLHLKQLQIQLFKKQQKRLYNYFKQKKIQFQSQMIRYCLIIKLQNNQKSKKVLFQQLISKNNKYYHHKILQFLQTTLYKHST